MSFLRYVIDCNGAIKAHLLSRKIDIEPTGSGWLVLVGMKASSHCLWAQRRRHSILLQTTSLGSFTENRILRLFPGQVTLGVFWGQFYQRKETPKNAEDRLKRAWTSKMTVFGSGLARYFVSVLGLGVFFLGLNYVNYGRHTSLQAEKAACNQAPPQEIVKVNLRFYGNLEA